MTNPPTATILHLSDLHLGENFDDAGDITKVSGASLRALSSLVTEGRYVLQTHDPVLCTTLPADIKSAARYVSAPGDFFDLNIVTGDVSTRADSDERFDFARDFLITDKVAVSSTTSMGLNLRKDATFCIPGNHDKMHEKTPVRFLRAFKDIPNEPPYSYKVKIERSKQQFIFWGIDSNLYVEGNIAAGRISDQTMGWLDKQLSSVEEQESEPVRILLLHHHPVDLNRFRRRLSLERLGRYVYDFERFTRLENGDNLLQLCRHKIDIIMHGHEHFPISFLDNDSGCFIVSAGTTSLYQVDHKHVNSFHALAFHGKRFRVVQFDRIKTRGGFGGFRAANVWEGDLAFPRRDLEGTFIR
jgi:3',5'-cyclic AMP phosphodiesterase CpdA